MVRTDVDLADGGDGVDRLARVAQMVTDAVALLNKAMEEIKAEKGRADDDGDAPGALDRDVEQPGRRSQGTD